MGWFIDYLKESIIGISIMATIYFSFKAYDKLSREQSKRGEMVKYVVKTGGNALFTIYIIMTIIGLIIAVVGIIFF